METLEDHKLTRVDINRRKKTTERQNNQKAKHKMVVVNPYRSVISLNINRLNLTNQKSQNGWIDLKTQDPTICHLLETYFSSEDTYRLQVKRWKTVFQENGNQKKSGIARFISDKID